MRQTRYLNFILTVNAVLLAALVWTNFASGPVLEREAQAQVRSRFSYPPNLPNAGAQRAAIVKAVKDLDKTVKGLASQMESGRIGVRITNADEIRAGD